MFFVDIILKLQFPVNQIHFLRNEEEHVDQSTNGNQTEENQSNNTSSVEEERNHRLTIIDDVELVEVVNEVVESNTINICTFIIKSYS